MRSSFKVGFSGAGLLPTRGGTGSGNILRTGFTPMGAMTQSLIPSVQDQFGPGSYAPFQGQLPGPLIQPQAPQNQGLEDWIVEPLDSFGGFFNPDALGPFLEQEPSPQLAPIWMQQTPPRTFQGYTPQSSAVDTLQKANAPSGSNGSGNTLWIIAAIGAAIAAGIALS